MLNKIAASPGDLDDFEAFIAEALRGRTGTERAEVERYLRDHPGEDIRDWKGKCDRWHLPQAKPEEQPWETLSLAHVRALATRELARRLPRNIRQAAARDPCLIWNELARRYRLKRPDDCDGEGEQNVPEPSRHGPAASPIRFLNTDF